MINLSIAIKSIYPHAEVGEIGTVQLQDDGDGNVYIAHWGLADPQPTNEELTTAELDGLKTYTAYPLVKAEAQRRIIDGLNLPIWKQINVTAQSVVITEKLAVGQALTTEEESFRTSAKTLWGGVAAIRAASDAIEADIAALTTAADIEAAIAGIPTNAKWP